MNADQKRHLAELIARHIFRVGDEPGSPANRMQYKGGSLTDKEIDQGGLIEIALVEVINTCLRGINLEDLE